MNIFRKSLQDVACQILLKSWGQLMSELLKNKGGLFLKNRLYKHL